MYMGYDDSYFEYYKSKCCLCGAYCYDWEQKCPNCGHVMFNEKFIAARKEILEGALEIARLSEEQKQQEREWQKEKPKRKWFGKKEPMFSEEEMLVTGLYPKTPFFKEYLILKILNKD